MKPRKISSRFYEYEVPENEQGKVNSSISKQDTNGGAINYARCARVLRRLDSCPGVLTASNMSTTQNSSTMSSICNTREPLWAEDFIDLSEFCQPSTIPTKMEDLADEHVTSPISSTVHDHGFDYALDVNDGLDNTIEDTFWCMGSPIGAMQEELCDPISDWLSVTSKETNNNNPNIGILNDNSCSRSQIYNINDTLLNTTTFTTSSAPKIAPAASVHITGASYDQHHRKDHLVNLLPSPPLQPDTTFFDSILNVDTASSSNESLSPPNLYQKATAANSLFSVAQPAPPKLPDTTFASSTFRHSRRSAMTSTTPTSSPPLLAEDTIIDIVPTTSAVLNRVAVDKSVSSPCSVQSPSITQSNSKIQETEKRTAVNGGIINRRNVKLKLKVEDAPRTSTCSMNTPEMLQPLVTKNSEFDLVSYVFDDNKPSISFDISSLHHNAASSNTRTKDTISAVAGAGSTTTSTTNTVMVPKSSPLNIKIEPKEEQTDEQQTTPKRIGIKRAYETDDSSDYTSSTKRSRRFSNVSQLDLDDLTQLESEKYRELRNRNNEASRRSRANRKSREVEMRDHASTLEAENRRLKVKAEEMEKLVKRLRNCLMQLVLKRR